MDNSGGPQLVNSSTLPSPPEFSFQPHQLMHSLDFCHQRNSFGFSPGTSPAPNDLRNDGADFFFDSQNCSPPPSNASLLDPPSFEQPQPLLKNTSCNPASTQSVPPTSRLQTTSTATKQRHGQLTPPSDSTPTKDNPPIEATQISAKLLSGLQAGSDSPRKRRSTQPNQSSEPTSTQAATASRQRKKTTRRRNLGLSATDGDSKRSQFLERNRVAASKCRQKKKEWTSNLEKRARELQARKTSLALLVSSLREELLYLKGEALKHTTCDCTSIRNYLARSVDMTRSLGQIDFAPSPHSGSNTSLDAIDMDLDIIHGSPQTPAMAESQELPELNLSTDLPD